VSHFLRRNDQIGVLNVSISSTLWQLVKKRLSERPKKPINATAGITQLVEHNLAKVTVGGKE
jgi:hypothetical protein